MSARPRPTRPPKRTGRSSSDDPFSVLSIGALAHAIGVPADTLRTWERRYGFPGPIERVVSGHRRYPLGAVERLRLAVRAMDLGHRPSVALRASLDTLRSLVAVSEQPASQPEPEREQTFVDRCLEYVRRLDDDGLVLELERAWTQAGAVEVLTGSVGPLLLAVGDGWSRGELEIGHEHFASEHVREFLSAKWRPLSTRAAGPIVVCATTTGELHVLGLHMAATALAIAGARVLFLGADTPPADVVRSAMNHRAAAVALSAANGANRHALEQDVAMIRSHLPPSMPIAAGGAGFGPVPPGVVLLPELRAVAAWVARLG